MRPSKKTWEWCWETAGIALILAGNVSLNAAEESPKREVRDIVGVCHSRGLYHLTGQDFLNEGADQLLELGTRVIKLAFRDEMETYYWFNTTWPRITSLIQLAETSYFQEVFRKPFTTYVLMTYTPGKEIHYFLQGMTPEDVQREQDSFYELTKYLLTRYQGTGKTFILQNWEGDWVLTPGDRNEPPWSTKTVDPKEAQGMIDWLNARQDGVDRARREIGCHGVTVAHAAEANLLGNALEGRPGVTNSVIPYTHCDLYSYSYHDLLFQGPEKLREALDYLAEKAPDSPLFGHQNLYLGEFGAAESYWGIEKRVEILKATVEAALDWGVQYALLWELYCDGPRTEAGRAIMQAVWRGAPAPGRLTNEDLVGNWLIRPDGSKSQAWDYFHELFQSEKK